MRLGKMRQLVLCGRHADLQDTVNAEKQCAGRSVRCATNLRYGQRSTAVFCSLIYTQSAWCASCRETGHPRRGWRGGLEGAWGRPFHPQKSTAHAVRRLMGFGARKTQVRILTMPPNQPCDRGPTYCERHAIFPPVRGHSTVGPGPGTLPD